MMIEGKEFMDWLHDVKKKMWEEEKKSGLSHAEWMRGITQEAEKILGQKIPKIEKIRQ